MKATNMACLFIMGLCTGFALAMALIAGGVGPTNPLVITAFGVVFIGTVAFWIGRLR